MLGWRILKEGEYDVGLPVLSMEEEGLIAAAEERFREATRSTQVQGRKESEEMIAGLVMDTAAAQGLYLDSGQSGYLSMVASAHIYGFAFMDVLLKDPRIEEISVIGPGMPVYAYLRDKGWTRVNACFDDEKTIADVVNRMSRELGRHITMQNPRLDAMLPDGSRLHASLPPVSKGEITIRKFRDRPYSPRELAGNKTIGMDALALVSILMQCDASVVIAGNTASGKTTTMNALFSFVPGNERVLITEETPEINIPHRHQVRLVANKEMGISLKDLVYDSLRMRPDRMIVGEVRNREEAEALFDVLLAGQARGSYATFHAQSTMEALSRMRSFGISDLDLGSIDFIIVQRRMLVYDPRKRQNFEVRRVVEMAEMADGPKIIYRHGKKMRNDCTLLEKACGSFGMNRREMAAELEKRRKMIACAEPEYTGFYQSVQTKLYGLDPG